MNNRVNRILLGIFLVLFLGLIFFLGSSFLIEPGVIEVCHSPTPISKSSPHIFDQNFSEKTMEGQMVKVLIKNGKIKEVVPINIQINNFSSQKSKSKSS